MPQGLGVAVRRYGFYGVSRAIAGLMAVSEKSAKRSFYEGKSGFYGFRAEDGIGAADFLLPDLR
jgi:hypothetical protein